MLLLSKWYELGEQSATLVPRLWLATANLDAGHCLHLLCNLPEEIAHTQAVFLPFVVWIPKLWCVEHPCC